MQDNQDVADKAVKEILGGGASVGDPAVVAALEQALLAARQGKIGSVAILQVGTQGQLGMQIAGTNIAGLIVCANQAVKMLTDNIFNPQQRRGPTIIAPPGH